MAYRRQQRAYSSSESDDSSSGYDDDRSVMSSSSRNSSRQSGVRSNNMVRAEVWRCRVCYREFTTRQGLNCHITVTHERARASRDEPDLEGFGQLNIRRASGRVPCTRCDKDYATQNNLDRHMREYHGGGAGASNTNVRLMKQTNIQNNIRIENNHFHYYGKK